jgi:CTP synthase
VLGYEDANSTEFDMDSTHPVISLMEEQNGVKNMGGTMRLGKQPAVLAGATRIQEAYGTERVSERHRHRYEFTNRYRDEMQRKGLVIAATSPDETLVEAIEYRDHPWGVGVQFHPEFKSKPIRAHVLFRDFIRESKLFKERQGATAAGRPKKSHETPSEKATSEGTASHGTASRERVLE